MTIYDPLDMADDELVEWSVSNSASLLLEVLKLTHESYIMHSLRGCSSWEEYKFKEGVVTGIGDVIDFINTLRLEYERRRGND